MKRNFNKKKLALFGLPILCLVLVSAALLTFYGQIQQDVNVEQAVILTCGISGCTENYLGETIYSGDTLISEVYTLTNNADTSRDVKLVTRYIPVIDVGEITTTYLKEVEYSFVEIVGTQPVNVNVEDLGDSIKWTVDFPGEEPYDGVTEGNGLMAVGLVIATDGEGEGPVFQIHNNDGSDSGYDWGTWLYSEWGPIDAGYYGWFTGTGGNNIPISNIDGVQATGERYNEVNPDGIFTITIDKSELGEDFHWALNLAIGSGFMGDYLTYEQM